MPESVPESEMPVAVMVLPVPTVLVAYVAVPETVSVSPATRLSTYVTGAVVLPSYVLPPPERVTVRLRVVMLAVVVAVVFGE